MEVIGSSPVVVGNSNVAQFFTLFVCHPFIHTGVFQLVEDVILNHVSAGSSPASCTQVWSVRLMV